MNEWMNLREERDFGEKFNATFLFARQNFKNLSLSLLLLGAPLMIAGNLLTAYFQLDLQMGTFTSLDQLPSGFFGFLSIILVVNMIAYSWLVTVTLSYMAEYLNGNRDIKPGQVFSRASKKVVQVIAASILSSIITMLGMVLLIIPGIYLAVALTLIYAIIIIEGDPTFESISRSFRLIGGKWWSTFGLIVVMGFVVGLMQLVFSIPTYINLFIKGLHQNLYAFDAGTIITQAIATVGITLLYPLIFIAIAFQYFNLVERKESEGLKLQIDIAGKQAETAPKNEGEY